jgi:hypothetical protein
MITLETSMACAGRSARVDAVVGALAFCLPLAAAPAYALMALATLLHGGSAAPVMCSSGSDLFSGMVPMYLLMSLFHCTRWLRWIGERYSRRTFQNTCSPVGSTPCRSDR